MALSAGDEVLARIRDDGVVAIIRGDFSFDRLRLLVDVLSSEGISAIELTLNSPGALLHLERLCSSVGPHVYFGAGTVRSRSDVHDAVSAGARFLVAPCLDSESVAEARRAGVPLIPGVFTATEAQAAVAQGCRLQKLFPAELGGAAYLAALRGPLDDVDFIPVGRIDPHDIAAYVAAGAVAVGVGRSLVAGPGVGLDEVRGLASSFVRAVGAARTDRAGG